MKALIVYDSTEGHTAQIAAFMVATLTGAAWGAHAQTPDTAPPPRGFDLYILAASLHVGAYQAGLVEYAKTYHAQLNRAMAAFVSVSLSAAGNNPGDRRGLARCFARFEAETGWAPTLIHHCGGAIRFDRYGPAKRIVIKLIAAARGVKTRFDRDYDLTDYDALRGFVLALAAQAARAGRPIVAA